MKLNLKGNTDKQYAVLILKYDFKLSLREIAQRMNMSISGVKYIIDTRR